MTALASRKMGQEKRVLRKVESLEGTKKVNAFKHLLGLEEPLAARS